MTTPFSKTRLLPALLAAALCACSTFPTPIHTGEKVMSELTKTMQPVCVGRLVIEIPAAAKISGWDQEVNYTKIKSLDHPSPDRKTFDAKIAQREKQLKTSLHDTYGILFKEKIRLSPDSELLVYRKNKVANRIYQLDTSFWHPTFEYLFHKEISNEDLAEGIARITNVVKSFIPMPSTTDLPNIPPGFCIEHGVITGDEFRSEGVSIGGLIDEYPGVHFSFSTQSIDQPYQDRTLLDRMGSSLSILGNLSSFGMKFIRKGKRTLNGQPGDEVVYVYTEDGITTMEAEAEFYYLAPTSLDRPFIKVTLSDQTHDDDTHQPYNKNLTQKEFLALWDTMLNSIRPRPKNLWGADSIKK